MIDGPPHEPGADAKPSASLRWRLRAALVTLTTIVATGGSLVFFHRGVGDFHGEPVGAWLCWRIFAMWGYGLLLSTACVSAGLRVLREVFRAEGLPTIEALVTSAALGLVVFVFGMYLGGFAHQFNAVFAIALPAAMIAAGAGDVVTFARARHALWQEAAPRPRELVSRSIAALASALGLLAVLAVYLGAMTPDAITFDASWTHLPIAVDYARAGRIIPFYSDYDRCVPHLASLVYTWAMIVPSASVLTEPPVRWMLAQHLEIVFFLWTLGGVAAMAAWLLDVPRVRGAWAAFFLGSAVFVYDKNLGGAADHYLAVFAAPLFLAAMRAAPRFEARACALAGVFAGAAILCKYQAAYLIAGVSLALAIRWLGAARARRAHRFAGEQDAPPSWRALAVGPLVLAGVAVLVTSPHFLKNWAFYGNPVYPFMQDIFASRPTVPNAAYLIEWILKDYRWRPHGGLLATVGEALALVFTWPFEAHYSYTKFVPDGGCLFVLGFPLLFALRSPRRIWLGWAAGAGCVFAWGLIFRVDRHLQTFMPLLAATTAAILVRAWELGRAARAGLSALVGVHVAWAADAPFYGAHAHVQDAIDLVRAGFEGKSAGRFKHYRRRERDIGASLPANARVVLHEVKQSLGMDRDVILDTPGRQALLSYDGVRGPRALHDLYRSLGATHLVWAPGRRPASTKAEDVLVVDYIHRFGKARHLFEDEEVVGLADAPPPPDHPYWVLALGLPGYADGLYAIDHMTTYEAITDLPGTHETFARPDRPAPDDDAASGLAATADAVCVAEGFGVGPRLDAQIDARFDVAVNYPHAFAIHVRRRGDAR